MELKFRGKTVWEAMGVTSSQPPSLKAERVLLTALDFEDARFPVASKFFVLVSRSDSSSVNIPALSWSSPEQWPSHPQVPIDTPYGGLPDELHLVPGGEGGGGLEFNGA